MPVFALIDAPVFPRPDLAEPSGLLAVGGDLRQERLLAAYRQGISPGTTTKVRSCGGRRIRVPLWNCPTACR